MAIITREALCEAYMRLWLIVVATLSLICCPVGVAAAQQKTALGVSGTSGGQSVTGTLKQPRIKKAHPPPPDINGITVNDSSEARDSDPLVWIGSIQTLVFILQLIAFVKTVKEMQRATELTQDSLRQTQRAFVFLAELELTRITKDGLTFTPIWKNSGGTPTKNLLTHFSGAHFPIANAQQFIFPDEGAAPLPCMIGPGATIRTTSFQIPRADIQAGVPPHLRILLYGWAEYNDIFRGTPRHRTEFCYELIMAEHPRNFGGERPDSEDEAQIRNAVVLRLYTQHNGATGSELYRLPDTNY